MLDVFYRMILSMALPYLNPGAVFSGKDRQDSQVRLNIPSYCALMLPKPGCGSLFHVAVPKAELEQLVEEADESIPGLDGYITFARSRAIGFPPRGLSRRS
jgi:hypothetical protein